MKANTCPQCGKDVMPYKRFLREAEPYKISECGSCGVKLRRSPRAYLYLAVMMVVLVALSIPLILALFHVRATFWLFFPLVLVWLACWVLLTNYLGWRLIGWVVVDKESKASNTPE